MKRTMSFIPYATPRMLLFLTLAVFAGVSDARACGNSGYTSVYDNGATIWATGTSVEDLYGFPIAIEVRLTSPSLRSNSDSAGFDGATTSTVSTSTSLSISDDDGTWWGNSDHYMLAYGLWNATTSSAAQRAIACRYPSGEISSAYNNSATHPYVAGFLADLAGGTGFDGRMVQEMITMTLADSCKAIFPASPFPEFVLSGTEIWTVGNIYLFTDPGGAYIGARSNG